MKAGWMCVHEATGNPIVSFEADRCRGAEQEVHETVLRELLPQWGVQWDQPTIDRAVKGWHTIRGEWGAHSTFS